MSKASIRRLTAEQRIQSVDQSQEERPDQLEAEPLGELAEAGSSRCQGHKDR